MVSLQQNKIKESVEFPLPADISHVIFLPTTVVNHRDL